MILFLTLVKYSAWMNLYISRLTDGKDRLKYSSLGVLSIAKGTKRVLQVHYTCKESLNLDIDVYSRGSMSFLTRQTLSCRLHNKQIRYQATNTSANIHPDQMNSSWTCLSHIGCPPSCEKWLMRGSLGDKIFETAESRLQSSFQFYALLEDLIPEVRRSSHSCVSSLSNVFITRLTRSRSTSSWPVWLRPTMLKYAEDTNCGIWPVHDSTTSILV